MVFSMIQSLRLNVGFFQNYIKKSNVGVATTGQRKNSDFEIGDEAVLRCQYYKTFGGLIYVLA